MPCAQYREKNRERIRVTDREYYKKNRTKIRTRAAAFLQKHKERLRPSLLAAQRKYKYGITQEQYDSMYMEQLGLCAACHEPFGDKKPCVDHNHKTGIIRGLVHHKCNTVMGLIDDDHTKLGFIVEFLQKHEKA